jgi:hypothetical protein
MSKQMKGEKGVGCSCRFDLIHGAHEQLSSDSDSAEIPAVGANTVRSVVDRGLPVPTANPLC